MKQLGLGGRLAFSQYRASTTASENGKRFCHYRNIAKALVDDQGRLNPRTV